MGEQVSALAAELERLRAENERLKSELAQARASGPRTVVGLTDLLLLVSAGDELTYLNSAAERFFKLPRAEGPPRPLAALGERPLPASALRELVQASREAAGPVSRDWKVEAASEGDARWFTATATPVANGTQLLICDCTALRRLESTLSRYLSPQVLKAVLQSGVDPYQARKYVLTVLFADLRGFTALSSRLPPEDVKRLIDEYLTVQIDVIVQEGATLDKIVGDEVMALFGAPLPAEHHAGWAINTALKMQEGHSRLMELWRRRGLPSCALGIGINSGEMVVGPIGSRMQMNYTVLGHNVNLAARLCSAAPGGDILLSSATFELARGDFGDGAVEAWRPFKFVKGEVLRAKGISEPVPTVRVVREVAA